MATSATRIGGWKLERRQGRGPGRLRMAAAGASLLIGAAAASGQGADRPEAAPVLLIERSGLDRWLVDERDAGMARALEMLPQRLRELPRESPEFRDFSPAMLDLVMTIIARPGRLAITYNPQDQTGGGFGLGIVAGIDARDREHAESLQGTVGAIMAQQRAPFQMTPSEAYPEMAETFLPFGLLRYGPRRSAADRWVWEVHFGSVGEPERAFGALPRAGLVGEGFSPIARASFDPAPLTPLLNMLRMFAAGQPGAQEGIEQIVEMGLLGPEAIKYDFQAGYLPDRSVTTWTLRGVKKFAPALGMATQPLAASVLAAIPADATVAGAMRFDVSGLLAQGRAALEQDPGVKEALQAFRDHTGVDLMDDLLAALGDTAGFYLSDSTGGGSLGSAVAFITLSDPERFRVANTRLTAAMNVFLQENPDLDGRVRGRRWTEDGTSFHSLTFAGLPVPLEPTYAVTNGMLVLGLTPQATLAAARQIAGKGDRGLTANEAFRAAMPEGREVTSVQFIDAARTMRGGYQYVSFFGSAVSNTVRSKFDASRDPGMIVPTFAELRRGARARITFSYWDGDNLVRRTEGNRSVLVESAAVIGAAEPLFPVIGAIIGGAGAAAQERGVRGGMRPGGW